MREVIACVRNRLKTIDEQILRLEKSIQAKGPNDLVVSTTRGSVRFYEYDSHTKEKTYLGNDDETRIRILAQKKYETKLLSVLKDERQLLTRQFTVLANSNKKTDCDLVLNSMKKEIQNYVEPLSIIDEEFVERFMGKRYSSLPKYDNYYETLSKDLVRSKSEVIIADRLFTAGIPFHYEERITIRDKDGNMLTYYPDFVCLNKRTKKIYYWEHLGMLGDPKYCTDNLSKLDTYSINGIIQGKNLIVSYECKDKPISTAYVDQMIRQFLV